MLTIPMKIAHVGIALFESSAGASFGISAGASGSAGASVGSGTSVGGTSVGGTSVGSAVGSSVGSYLGSVEGFHWEDQCVFIVEIPMQRINRSVSFSSKFVIQCDPGGLAVAPHIVWCQNYVPFETPFGGHVDLISSIIFSDHPNLVTFKFTFAILEFISSAPIPVGFGVKFFGIFRDMAGLTGYPSSVSIHGLVAMWCIGMTGGTGL